MTPLRLLLIEDNADDALLLERALADGGFAPDMERVTTEAEVRDALALGPWDAVISDDRLPRFDGLAALRVAHEVDPDLPVLIVSGVRDESFIVEAMRAGAWDFIVKERLVRLAPALRRTLEATAVQRKHRRAESDLERSLRHFELLASSAEQLLQSTNPQAEVESLCRRVMAELDCQFFFNFLVEPDAGRLRLNACAGISPDEARKIEWLDYGVAVCGCAARDGCRIVAEYVRETPDPRTELVKSYGVRAYACHPLLGPGGPVIGTLSFGTKTRDTFSADDLALMKAMTDQVAMAMTRIRHEQELRGRERLLETVLDTLPVGVSVLDADGRVTRVNARFNAIWRGAANELPLPEDIEGTRAYRGWWADSGEVIAPEEWASSRALLRGEVSLNEVITIQRIDGTRGAVLNSASPLRDAAGRITGAVVALQDISALRELQERERRLLYMVAHDLRAPATIISGYLELLTDALDDSDASRPTLDALRRALHRLNLVVDNLTELTRLTGEQVTLAIRPVALPAFLTDLLARSSAVLDAARVTLALPENLPPVAADPGALDRVLTHLLSNALKYSTGPVRVSAAPANGAVAIAVADQGQGIATADLPHLFERFYRAQRRRAEGLGLGLYLTKLLVDAMDGRITVDSTPGQGSTFTVTLPAAT
ncbi:MAG: Alkaline phosphatase synthesis sensor protein PhoR [bacterium ADurb.Bin429]|nr:MAG: Alkaline phosphatase synthesis sensor protein PhoR [bacterium ADurb.Bin429]